MKFGLIPVNVGVKSVAHIVGLAQLVPLAAAGASRIIVPVLALGKDPVAGIARLAEDIISRC